MPSAVSAKAAADRPFIEPWAAMLGREAAQAIYPLQRARLRLAVANIVVLVLVAITTPIVGRTLGGFGAIGAATVVVLVAYLAVMLSLIIVTARRVQAAEREIGSALDHLGGPAGVVPLMSVGAFRRWADRRNVDTKLVGQAVVLWFSGRIS